MLELASIMNSVAVPVFALDVDAHYVYENELAQDFLGYDAGVISDKHLTDLVFYDPVLLMAGFQGLKRRGYFSGRVRYKHRNGSLVDADVNTFRKTLADGSTVFVSLVHPLTGVRTKLPEVPLEGSEYGLTGEEVRLLHLLAEGFPDAEVACLLGEPEDAIGEQVRLVLEKMNASSRTHAVVLALKKRILL
jgi:PAS domain S-box-containing protein